uniref:Enhancer of rudimentary homolog n=1 Tax=Spumella elongata TaxID=89044 RepID=A0A7S3HCL7_9STRA|mmetsp:Transcript_45548/g.79632  ORF Transcript_45548/g.79632 Transcript_45548/m.79632 type:complete len:106 (+) Transcript_45548:53-370(+)|eukprot:CAMPEP_0184986792 /NCGR_PEP_ID=MMETSP1098-20130426/17839_1 /TAXON_ID=89044 /ORGANISM="Spumella elongata, Strain CCAP 955/1" /LENGTH=105 /DNA_ID=CAMNT_0027511153 /DNA_START=50 /DNA_END=367 /DNA_ORIENTATION=+
MSGGAGKHTIILVQYSNSFQSRSYMEFPAVNAALDALVKMYEHKLKELNPSVPNITYDISDLYQYLDSLHDLCGLVLDPNSNKYEPKDRKWLKEKIFAHLRGQAK